MHLRAGRMPVFHHLTQIEKKHLMNYVHPHPFPLLLALTPSDAETVRILRRGDRQNPQHVETVRILKHRDRQNPQMLRPSGFI